MRYLRKKGTVEPRFPFHPILAARGDIEVVEEPDNAGNAAASKGAKPAREGDVKSESGHEPTGDTKPEPKNAGRKQ